MSVGISGGTFSLDAAEDGVHSNNGITIGGGTLNLAVMSMPIGCILARPPQIVAGCRVT